MIPETTIVELSLGLGAAAIIIDKVLNWTVKWKKTNGNGKDIYKHPDWVIHNRDQIEMRICLQEIVRTQINQTLILTRMAESDVVKVDLLKEIKGLERQHGPDKG